MFRRISSIFFILLSLSAFSAELDGISGVYDDIELIHSAAPKLCILDTEHPDVIRAQIADKGVDQYRSVRLKKDILRLGVPSCLLYHYSEFKAEDFNDPSVKAVIVLPRKKMLSRKYDEVLFDFLRKNETPILGICGAHQMIAEAYGGRFALMRPLKSGERDLNPLKSPGYFKEWGFYKVTLLKEDPIFKDIKNPASFRMLHSYEIKELPGDFEILASTAECGIQVIRHKKKILYGTQFHPELYDSTHKDGEQFLKNFLSISALIKPD